MTKGVGLALILAIGLSLGVSGTEQSNEKVARMQWFEQAKLGIFIV